MKKIQFVLDFDVPVEEYLKKEIPKLRDYRIISQSLDARGAPRGKKPVYLYQIEYTLIGDQTDAKEEIFPQLGPLKQKPIIIGAGPCGLYAALRFAEYGIPVRIFERGEEAQKRMVDISKFWRYGEFNPESNVCYGEGGAGLFSDGKLITRVKSHYIPYVMKKFVDFGAPPEVAYTSNPHLGSNKIRSIITFMSQYLRKNGSDIFYNTRIDKLLFEGKKIIGVETHKGEKFYSDYVILATGHSAHEMYDELLREQVAMKSKDFAIGVRVEHPREEIDKIQHGQWSQSDILGAARYRLSWHDDSLDIGTYSFCMCPGGYVLSSGSDKDGLVSNGMSNFARNSHWSNSALVVSIKTDQLPDTSLLKGLHFQRNIEKEAYIQSKKHASGKELPAQKVMDFFKNKTTEKHQLPNSSCPSKLYSFNLHQLLPKTVTDHLKEALNHFDRMMKGFISEKALFIAPETRTSAPLSILRDHKTLESLSHQGLYPCGEGAGHAGGITSAAVDGVKVAMSIIEKEFKLN